MTIVDDTGAALPSSLADSNESRKRIPIREKVVGTLLYALLMTFLASGLIYFVYPAKGPSAQAAERVFWSMLSAFMGYVLGTNKTRS